MLSPKGFAHVFNRVHAITCDKSCLYKVIDTDRGPDRAERKGFHILRSGETSTWPHDFLGQLYVHFSMKFNLLGPNVPDLAN